uniref:cyclic nucleotide-binding domain-containing protein n=1 Tax=Chamaesiphon sp. GL140_3_metabinner_50 TaxID=2970812 RepID=UPI0025E7F049
TLFWGAIVPSSIFILLVFGHEVWRRICPLSFLSQIPRALGKQRQFKRKNPNTGKVRYELAKVKSDSWLGRNYPYVQFSWLFVGLCGRILFFDADRLVLALWILFTIAAAITVGYLYGGKSWCNYFCPMAPVQQIYSEPGGLLSSKAHISDTSITQAKVLPGFTREKRHTAYKGVVREALEEGYANYSSSLEVLQQLRQELGITDDEHRQVLEELGIEDPELLNPDRKRSLENQIRLTGYRKSLERLMLLQRQQDLTNPDRSLDRNSVEIDALRRQYSINPQDEDWILNGISPESGSLRRADFLLAQLPDLINCYRGLNQPILSEHQAVLLLLKSSIHHKKELIVRNILEAIVSLKGDKSAISLAQQLGNLAPVVLLELLESDDWHQRLHPEIIEQLKPFPGLINACAIDYSSEETLNSLSPLLDDRNPLIQTACLYIIAQLDFARSQAIARNYTDPQSSSLVNEAVKIILSASKQCPPLKTFALLEKVVHLFNSDFFNRIHSETLIALSERAEFRTFTDDEVITEAGDTCRELLLLIEGNAQILFHLPNQEVRIEQLKLGQTLDELEVLAHSDSQNTIVATGDFTRILAVPVAAFDDLLVGGASRNENRDRDFARRVLELESRQLQRFMRSLQSI